MKEKIEKYKQNMCGFWQRNSFLVKPFLVILLIYLMGILAILLAGVHYADDVARTQGGYAGWSGFSRYLSTILAHGLHADNYLTNIYPLPVVILALASLIIIVIVAGKGIFKQKWIKWIWSVIAVVPVGLSPYMLECLSYQYDAPYMALSVLAAVMPLTFCNKSKIVYSLAVAGGILVVCMTYQASIGIFPMLVIFAALREWSEGRKGNSKEVWKFLGVSAAVFLLTVVVFQKFLMIPRDAYASNSLPEAGEFLSKFFAHLGQYFELVVSDFKILWLVLIGILVLSFIVIFVLRSKKKKVLAGLVGVVGVILMAVAAYALYAALDKPLYTTRAMYAIGAWIAIMGVYMSVGVYSKWIVKVPVVILSFCFVVFGFTYGNALGEQNDYRNRQVNMVITELNRLDVMQTEGIKTIQVDGQIGLSPVIKNMPRSDYEILYRLLKPSFGKDVPWMAYGITYGSGFSNLAYNPDANIAEMNLPVLKETVFYTIKGNDKYIMVEFRGEDLGVEF